MTNVLENGDFSEVQGYQPELWDGFGYCSVRVADEKYEGMNVCRTVERTETYSGMSQDVNYTVHLGRRYKFSVNAKLADCDPKERHHIKVTIQYRTSKDTEAQYLKVAESDIGSDKWYKVTGRLNMPKGGTAVTLEKACLYVEGPEPRVNIMIADIRLVDMSEIKNEAVAAAGGASRAAGETCDIFISYQWGIQDQMKKLKLYLESKGYKCWMDIGQMGGGDTLYGEIEAGVRGCKVMLCNLTEKYLKSDNCIKEVSLGELIKKPMIPLLWEMSAWPPQGPLAMIFAPLLFVKMVPKPNHKLIDGMPEPKLQELLAEIEQRVKKS